MTLAVVVLGLAVLGLLVVVVVLSLRGGKRGAALEAGLLQQRMAGVELSLKGLEGSLRDSLTRDLQETRQAVAGLRIIHEERQRIEDEMRLATRRIEQVLTGTTSRGEAGENILAEAFRHFPPGLIEPDFRVKGKVVEYALVLPSGRRLPIDSRWPDPELLASLATATDPQQREALVHQVEGNIEQKVRQVVQYIDAASTVTFAIAAIPDSAFAACGRAHHHAYRYNVILMPYSMTIPYLLALYRMHLQYAGSIDMERLAAYLSQLEDGLRGLDEALDNSIHRGATMVLNAYQKGKNIVGDLRQAIPYLQAPTTPRITLPPEGGGPTGDDPPPGMPG